MYGACGYHAARAALGEHGRFGPLRRRLTATLLEHLYADARPT